jgi:2-(1,2-epoxy-1,2-dihydrophenyl)acetyl-CoA isomerase
MATRDTLQVTRQDGVCTIRLNRPEALNALNATMVDELDAVLRALRVDEETRAVVLTGAGGAFCAGGDVRGMAEAGQRPAHEARAGMALAHRLVTGLRDLQQPVIAAVDGVAYGAGFSLVLLADIVLVSDRARLCMAFQRIGLVPDTAALFTLPRIVGLQRAKELMLSAREVLAPEAKDLGIAMEVCPAAALQERAQSIARSLCGGSPVALALTKRALDNSLQSDLAGMLEMEAAAQGIARASAYHLEAARRFVAKEPPQFRWPQG